MPQYYDNPYYEQDSFLPARKSRVDDQFDQINFGAQNKYGDDSLSDWQSQVQEPRRNPMGGFMDSLRSAYGKTPALDEYRQFLSDSPRSADYAPSKWDRVAAAFGGIAAGVRDPTRGVELARNMNRSKYDTALKDYYAQAAPLKEAAGIERESMTDRVKALLEGRKSQQDYLDYQRNLSKDEQDYLIATGKLKVDQDTLGLNREKFGQDTYNTGRQFGLDEREYQSLDRYRKRTGDVQGYNAKTNRMDTESAIQRRADQTFFDNMGAGKGDTVSAADVGRAEKDALGSMANDFPEGTLEYNEYSDQWQIGRNVDPNTRAIILAELEKRVGSRTSGGLSGGGGMTNFGGSYNPNPPPDLPNFGPSQSQRRGGSRYGGGRQ